LATGRDLRLVATARPGITQGAPLRKTRLILEQDQPFATLGRPYNRWPLVLQPRQALGRVEMVRDKARLLKRKPQVVEQRTHIMTVIEDAKLAPNQHPDQDRVPTGRLQAHDEWAGLKQRDQAFPLRGGQLLWAPPAMAIDQAVHAPQQKGLPPVVETGGAEAPAVTEHLHGHLVYQQVEQHRDAPCQSHIIALIGMLQTAMQLFDSRTTELYPETHGCILLVGCLACVLGEIHPCARESQPGISNSFSEDL